MFWQCTLQWSKTAKNARFSFLYNPRSNLTCNKSCFQCPRVVFCSLNYSRLVFRLLFLITLYATFWPFLHTFRNFSPQKQHFCASKSRNNCQYYFSWLSEGSRLLLHHVLQGYACSNQGKHQKNPKIAIFAENLVCRYIARSVTDLHQQIPTKKSAISKISRTMSHLCLAAIVLHSLKS